MDPVSLAAVTSVAATGFGVASKIQAGQSAADASDYQAALAKRSAEIGTIKAQQTDAIMQTNLQSTLANIRAVRAGAGVDPDSPTGNAIMARQEAIGDQDRAQRVENITSQVTSDQNAAAFYKSSATNALLGGFMGAGGDLLSGLSGALKSKFPGT